jgi:hypothetical protein
MVRKQNTETPQDEIISNEEYIPSCEGDFGAIETNGKLQATSTPSVFLDEEGQLYIVSKDVYGYLPKLRKLSIAITNPSKLFRK